MRLSKQLFTALICVYLQNLLLDVHVFRAETWKSYNFLFDQICWLIWWLSVLRQDVLRICRHRSMAKGSDVVVTRYDYVSCFYCWLNNNWLWFENLNFIWNLRFFEFIVRICFYLYWFVNICTQWSNIVLFYHWNSRPI